MPYLIGTDEAGYGPNLGPLVVAASAWEVPPKTQADSLYERLEKVVSVALPADGDSRLPMADSKVLYKAGSGLEVLERSVLCALRCQVPLPASGASCGPRSSIGV